ncbi:Uncharacterised protein [Klebsiella pneumoniae]|nr:Uncharacterised protein [Klebsiella pneumoniae]
MRVKGRFCRVHLAHGSANVAAQRLQVRAAGQQLKRERVRERFLQRRQRHGVNLRHAMRIGADQRPQGFPVLRQRPLRRNHLLRRRQQLRLGIGDIDAILDAARGTMLVRLHREAGDSLQLVE